MTVLFKPQILVVDDDLVVRLLCQSVLRRQEFIPIVAADGLEGLEIYRERHQHIHVVVSDILMPVMGGVEMVRKIFEIQAKANIIMMSGANTEDLTPDEVKKLCSVIEKPFIPRALVESVKKCLQFDAEHHPELAFST